jgi:hypothetical protein
LTITNLVLCVFAGSAANGQDAYLNKVAPLLQRYCVECHNDDDAEASIALDAYASQAEAVEDGETWLRVMDALESRAMPPADRPQPTLVELDQIVNWIEKDFLAAQCENQAGTAPVVIRRLNRQEYDNTIRDLLGIDLRLSDSFPMDEIGFGFDNVGSALNISPIHVEKYLDAAERATEAAIVPPDSEGMPPIELIGLKTYPLKRGEPVVFDHSLKPGAYLVDFSLVRVGIAESAPTPRLLVSFGADSRAVEASRVQDETVVYRFWLGVGEGDRQVKVVLPEQAKTERPDAAGAEIADNVSGDQRYGSDRGLHVDSMVVRGPVVRDPLSLPESHRAILFRAPGWGDAARNAAAREIVTRFADRAFRRPARPDETDRVMAIFALAHDRGESFERAIQIALTTVLVSPQFLYLIEPEDGTENRPLNEFELASRLSYFLWSSMPDERLFAEARAGTLRRNIRAQVVRMLESEKSKALVENFAGQWLQLRKLAGVAPDPNLFPQFDDALRDAMRRETEQYFGHILRTNQSALDLIDSDYAFLNETLAKHYGISGVKGAEFVRVPLGDRRRGGVLTQGSVLTLTSNPNRTSPVKRGQWILQQILGTPPPPPPPEVEKLDESPQSAQAASLRERMESHRANPSCASCHQQMDPLGFALENYDPVGRWRTSDGPYQVDPSGELAGGQAFADISELKRILRTKASKKFARCLIENMLTYALGRGLEPFDYCTVEAIRAQLESDEFRIHAIVFGIVQSDAFQSRGVAK